MHIPYLTELVHNIYWKDMVPNNYYLLHPRNSLVGQGNRKLLFGGGKKIAPHRK